MSGDHKVVKMYLDMDISVPNLIATHSIVVEIFDRYHLQTFPPLELAWLKSKKLSCADSNNAAASSKNSCALICVIRQY